MEIDPKWLHQLEHEYALKKRKCKTCKKSSKKLYHCKSCMKGVYCGVECQVKDTEHPCLIEGRRRKAPDEEFGGDKKKAREEVQLEPQNIIENLPVELYGLLFEWMDSNSVFNLTNMSVFLKKRISAKWLKYIPITITLGPNQTLKSIFNDEQWKKY